MFFNEDRVGGHDESGLDLEHVADQQFLVVYFLEATVSHHLDFFVLTFFEQVFELLGLGVVVHCRDRHHDGYGRQYRHCFEPAVLYAFSGDADHEGDDGSHAQDLEGEVFEASEEDVEQRFRRRLHQLVAAEVFYSLLLAELVVGDAALEGSAQTGLQAMGAACFGELGLTVA